MHAYASTSRVRPRLVNRRGTWRNREGSFFIVKRGAALHGIAGWKFRGKEDTVAPQVIGEMLCAEATATMENAVRLQEGKPERIWWDRQRGPNSMNGRLALRHGSVLARQNGYAFRHALAPAASCW